MKVVISTYTYLPDIGGVATTVSILASAFVQAGHQTTVVTLTPGPVHHYGYRVVRRPSPLHLFRLYAEADLLLLSNLSLKLMYPLFIIDRSLGLHHHSDAAFASGRKSRFITYLRRLMVERATNIVTSRYIGLTSGLKAWTVVYPFANPEHVTPEVRFPVSERDGLLFVGRLEKEKGVAFMLQHWPRMREALGVAELRIIGDGDLEPYVRERAAGLDGVVYMGRRDLTSTAQEMGRAAYAIVPSLWAEPFGAVAIEALGAGALVILSNRGGLPETCDELGFYFDPDSEASFTAALANAAAARAAQLSSAQVRESYINAVDERLKRFSPNIAVETLIRTLTPSLAAYPPAR